MSGSESEKKAEELLLRLANVWPGQARSEAAWEEQATSIVSKIRNTKGGSTPDELLSAPLAPEPGERSSSPSLAELARSMKSPAAEPDDISELARTTLSVAKSARHSTPDLALRAHKASSPELPTPSAEPAAPASARPRSSNRAIAWVAAAAVSLAAAAAIVVRSRDLPTEPERLQARSPAASNRAAGARSTSLQPEQPPTLAIEAPPGEKPARAKARFPSDRAAAGSSRSPALVALPKASTAPEEKPQAETLRPPAEADSLEPNPKLKPADGRQALAQNPSHGAVTAALDAVMQRARQCLAGHDKSVPVVIIFGSDGRVQSVSAGGAAAGTPSAGCIQAALGKARVQPFAKPSWTVPRTVRPP